MTRGWLSLVAGGLLVASSAQAAPRWLRSSFTGPTDSSATVSWTDDILASGAAEYRRADGAGEVGTVTARATPTGTDELGITYVARFSGLEASTGYEYRVGTSGAWSSWASFRTAPPAGGCAPFRFAAVGDSRGQELPLAGYQPSIQWDEILAAMATEDPLFVLHSGDYVYSGDRGGQWESELSLLGPLSRKVPFFMSLGNHDDGPGEGAGAHFNAVFETPANGPDAVDDTFAFVAGNALFVGLSTYTFSMDAQIDWLRTQLEAHRGLVDWRVLLFHTPVWSSGNHGDNEDDRTRAERLVPLLDEFGVELVINGHDHDYERFHPSRGGFGGVERVVTPLAFDGGRRGIPEGTTFLVAGGGGALVNPLFAPGEHSVGSKNLHYLVVDVAGPRMSLTVRDCGAQGLGGASCSGEIEYVVLEKAEAVCGTGAADAGMPDGGEADAGLEPDAGDPDAAVEDAGEAEEDAGVPADAGSGADAGAPLDAGSPAGNAPEAEPGCGCGASGASGAAAAGLLSVLALGWARRRG